MDHRARMKARRAAWRDTSPNHGKPWTRHQRQLALEMRERSKSYGQIALRIGKTPDAIASYLRAITIGGGE